MVGRGQQLIMDPAMGMAGDMFAAALLGLQVPPKDVIHVMEFAAQDIGGATVTAHPESVATEKLAYRLSTHLHRDHGSISISHALAVLEKTITHADIDEPYAGFARRALSILADAEAEAHRLLDIQQRGGDARVLRSVMPLKPRHAHTHETHLHEAQDIVMDLAAASWGLQYLAVDLGNVRCTKPIMTGRGTVRFSHGELPIPAPATRAILDRFSLSWSLGPMDFEQLTPTGAAILAALNPTLVPRGTAQVASGLQGHGLGTKQSNPPNLLTLNLQHVSKETHNAG